MVYYHNNSRGCDDGITHREDLTEYEVEMASCGMLHIPSFMMIAEGIQALLRFRFSFRNLRGRNVDSFINIGSGVQKVIRRVTHTDTQTHTNTNTDMNVISYAHFCFFTIRILG
jgi:hypothetical protein